MKLSRKIVNIVAAAVIGITVCLPGVVSAINDSIDIPTVVQQDPADWTPQVPGTWNAGTASDQYQVMTLVPVGSNMYAGGLFPTVTNPTKTVSYPRNNIFAFNSKTGAVTSFAPNFDGQVNAIVPSADGKTLFVGGEFTHVNGVARSKFAKIDATTGALVAGFPNVKIGGKVTDLDMLNGNVIVAGKFKTVNGAAKTGLVSINPTTGAVTNYMNVVLGGELNATSTQGIWRIAISPDQTKLAVTGSFLTVNGQSRLQLFLLNLTPTGTSLSTWDSEILHIASCSQMASGNAQVIGDIDFSGDSRYLYVGSGGGPRGLNTICDAITKFDTSVASSKSIPVWLSDADQDTIRSIVWTSAAIYVGGHQKSLNASGFPGGPYVPRPGLGALEGATGKAMAWNPGHDREIGTQVLIVTNSATQPGQPTGLWIGSDSGGCGLNIGEKLNHAGICFFPQ